MSTVVNNFRFPGQYYDDETGLHYNWHRYYDPGAGRYLTKDPIGIKKGKNHLYVYADNNPINLIDPFGLSSCKGQWIVFHWIKKYGDSVLQVVTSKCICYWTCRPCDKQRAIIWSGSLLGLPTTTGTIFYQGQDIEGGDYCNCLPPGSETGCECNQ